MHGENTNTRLNDLPDHPPQVLAASAASSRVPRQRRARLQVQGYHCFQFVTLLVTVPFQMLLIGSVNLVRQYILFGLVIRIPLAPFGLILTFRPSTQFLVPLDKCVSLARGGLAAASLPLPPPDGERQTIEYTVVVMSRGPWRCTW